MWLAPCSLDNSLHISTTYSQGFVLISILQDTYCYISFLCL